MKHGIAQEGRIMADENTELQEDTEEVQKEYEELQKEYEDLQKEVEEELAMQDGGVSDTGMHIFNISLAAVMIIIGIFLVYKTRNIKQKSGKKIAGWILLILGVLTLLTHVIQLIV